jgi:hypothetical protein
VPVVAVLRPVLPLAGVNPNGALGGAVLSYAATIAVAVVPATVAALCLFWVTRRLGGTSGSGLIVALVFALGTPMWAYATVFLGHALATASLVVSFTAAVALRDEGSARRDFCLGLIVGGAGGWAIVTEFPLAVPVALVAGFALLNARGRPETLRYVAVGGLLGGGATLCVLGLYQLSAFGSPFHLGYANDEFAMPGFFGIGVPRLRVLRELTVGRYRGLLPLAPVLALAPFGVLLLWRARQAGVAIVAAAIVVYFFLLNGGYTYWTGGY